jgi:hypothetical protein
VSSTSTGHGRQTTQHIHERRDCTHTGGKCSRIAWNSSSLPDARPGSSAVMMCEACGPMPARKCVDAAVSRLLSHTVYTRQPTVAADSELTLEPDQFVSRDLDAVQLKGGHIQRLRTFRCHNNVNPPNFQPSRLAQPHCVRMRVQC